MGLEQTGRYMCADRLDWTDDRPRSPGPPTDPQPVPPHPLFRDRFESGPGRPNPERWQVQGPWEVAGGELLQGGDQSSATALLRVEAPPSFLFEVNTASRGDTVRAGTYGAVLSYRDGENHTAVFLQPHAGLLSWRTLRAGEVAASGDLTRLRPDFRDGAYHQRLLRREGPAVGVTLDGVAVGPVPCDPRPRAVGLFTAGAPVAFATVTLSDLRADPGPG